MNTRVFIDFAEFLSTADLFTYAQFSLSMELIDKFEAVDDEFNFFKFSRGEFEIERGHRGVGVFLDKVRIVRVLHEFVEFENGPWIQDLEAYFSSFPARYKSVVYACEESMARKQQEEEEKERQKILQLTNDYIPQVL